MHQRVERVAVLAEGVLDVAVVGRVLRRGEQRPVQPHAAGLVVDLVLVAAAARDLDQDVELHGGAPLRRVADRHSLTHRESGGTVRLVVAAPSPCWRSCSRSSRLRRRRRAAAAPARTTDAGAAASAPCPPRSSRGDRRARAAARGPARHRLRRRRRSPRRSAPCSHAPGFGGRLLAAVADAATGTRALYDQPGATPGRAGVDRQAAHRGRAPGRARRRPTGSPRRSSRRRHGHVVLVGGGDPTLGRSAGQADRLPRRGPDQRPGRPAARAPRHRARASSSTARCSPGRPSRRTGTPADCRPTTPRRSPRSWSTAAGRAAGRCVRSATPDLAAGRGAGRRCSAPRSCRSRRGTAPPGPTRWRRVQSAPLSALVDADAAGLGQRHRRGPGPAGRDRRAPAGVLHRRGARRSARCSPGSASTSAPACTTAAGCRRRPGQPGRAGRGAAPDRRHGPPRRGAAALIAAALPVAGWSGTLARPLHAPAPSGSPPGRVRAKTGTLSRCRRWPGSCTTRPGGCWCSPSIADRAVGTVRRRGGRSTTALDAAAADARRCGCR